MIRIAICDDYQEQVDLLHRLVLKFLDSHRERAEIARYTQSRMLLYDIQEGAHFDLVLSDIEMPHVDGMELATGIRQLLPECITIFITSHLKYSVDAYELNIFRYIPKNELEPRLVQALRDAFSMLHLQEGQFYTIESAHRLEKILWKNIVYIQREGKNAVFYLLDGSRTKVRKSLAQVFEQLAEDSFVYVDRGTIVNLAHVVRIKDNKVELKMNGSQTEEKKRDSCVAVETSPLRLEQLKTELRKYWSRLI